MIIVSENRYNSMKMYNYCLIIYIELMRMHENEYRI